MKKCRGCTVGKPLFWGDDMIRLQMNSSAFQAALQAKMQKLETTTKEQILRDVGDLMVRATGENFENEQGPDGRKWIPRSIETVDVYERAGKAGNKLLHDNGDLRNSVGTYEVSANSVRITARTRYARIHQNGQYRAGIRSPVMGRLGIPARPYMGFSAGLRRDIKKVVIYHLNRL